MHPLWSQPARLIAQHLGKPVGCIVLWESGRVRSRDMFELTDLLYDGSLDADRSRLRRDDLAQHCIDRGDRWAARIVQTLPSVDGWLVNDDIDRLLLAAHCEIQRLAEEFRQGARLWGFLRPVLEVLRRSCIEPPYRIVDVGCGTGYVIRWLAAHEPQPDVELIGVDFNTSLVDAARGLAAQEDLRCHFAVGDAFALDEPATIVISTGVLHHFRGDDLDRFFAAHQSSAPAAFVHVDFQPSPIAGFGAWLFHRTRMRLAISRHDGIRSAQRAHPPDLLVRTAAAEAPDYVTWVSGRRVRGTPFPCVLTNLIGARRELGDLMRDELDRHLDGPEAVR